MNFFFIASLLVAVASASEADQAPEATANLRGVANNADQENLEAFEALMAVYHANRACPAYKGCTAYDYCRSSGCGPCKNDSCTQPGGRGGGRGGGGRGGGRGGRGGGWCQHLKGCSWHDYCKGSGCGKCDKKRDQCTKPRDEDEEEFNQDAVDTTTE